MSARAVQTAAPGGWYVHASEQTRGITYASGPTPPADASVGFAPGCLFIDTNAAADSQVYVNVGTRASSNFDALALSTSILANQTLTTGAGAGITGGTGTVYWNQLGKAGGKFETTIFIDLTGLGTSTTDLDIIGQSTTPAYICKLTAAETGATIDAISMQCLETPATGADDIDLYSATEGTGKFDDAITGLTETALLTSGAAWTAGVSKGATVCPTAEEYLYLCNGEAATVGTFTAGKFVIKIYGH